jgi:pimeloyl-ACP methyl ester carboxylesterase
MDNRIPLVLLPGLLCDEALWKHQINELSDVADCQVPDFTTQDTVAAMAHSVLDNMPGRFALAALSMGGYVALEVMRQASERVSRLALLDTQPLRDTPEQAERRRHFVQLAEQGDFDYVIESFPPLLFHESRLADRALVSEFTAMAVKVGRQAFIRQQNAIITRPDSSATLFTIGCPTLVACGRQDAITPLENSEKMAAEIPNSRLVIFEDCGHMSTMEVPEQVNEALRDWLLAGSSVNRE